MGIWPFGRDPAEIEIATRVITAGTQNGFTVRGKLTIHFAEPQRQGDADEAADRMAQIAMALLRESQSHDRVIGAEAHLNALLMSRYPPDIAPARVVEVAALHVVGDPALSDELRRANTGTFRAPRIPPSSPPSGPLATPAPYSRPTPPLGMNQIAPNSAPLSQPTPQVPSASPMSTPPTSKRRGSTSQLRSIQSLLMPPGTPPSAMGAYVAPIARDSAARLLVGYLRAHDLITLRGVAMDASSAETFASLVPASDAAPGGYEQSRATELGRWQGTLGADVVMALHRETSALSTYLAREAMLRAEVPRTLALAVTDALCTAAFPALAGLRDELNRFADALSPTLVSELAERLSTIADAGDDPRAITAALTPLCAVIQEDLNVSAMIIKLSSS